MGALRLPSCSEARCSPDKRANVGSLRAANTVGGAARAIAHEGESQVRTSIDHGLVADRTSGTTMDRPLCRVSFDPHTERAGNVGSHPVKPLRAIAVHEDMLGVRFRCELKDATDESGVGPLARTGDENAHGKTSNRETLQQRNAEAVIDVRLDWQSAEVADAHVEKDRDEGDIGNEGNEEHEFGVGELVHDGSFLVG